MILIHPVSLHVVFSVEFTEVSLAFKLKLLVRRVSLGLLDCQLKVMVTFSGDYADVDVKGDGDKDVVDKW